MCPPLATSEFLHSAVALIERRRAAAPPSTMRKIRVSHKSAVQVSRALPTSDTSNGRWKFSRFMPERGGHSSARWSALVREEPRKQIDRALGCSSRRDRESQTQRPSAAVITRTVDVRTDLTQVRRVGRASFQVDAFHLFIFATPSRTPLNRRCVTAFASIIADDDFCNDDSVAGRRGSKRQRNSRRSS